MKRIGVLSLVFDNYGTRLQSYALFKILKGIVEDDEIEFINVENTWNPRNDRLVYIKLLLKKTKAYGIIGLYKCFELLRWLVESKLLRKQVDLQKLNAQRHALFNHIISLIPYTEKFYTCQNIRNGELSHYDAVIVGSDQVWNSEKVGNQDVFMLDFVGDFKRLTYAASFGITHIPSAMQNDFKRRMEKFSSLLVREKEAAELCHKLGRYDAQVVLDPTLLLYSKDYDKDFSNSEIHISGDYVLVYSLNYSYKIYDEAYRFCQENHCKMVVLKRSICPPKKLIDSEEIFAASPEAFLNLIKNAKVVITNSYHALLFSIIYKSSFFLYLDDADEENSRLLTVANMFNLEQHVFWESGSLPSKLIEINYDRVYEILKKERKRSIELLSGAVKNIKRSVEDA